MNYSELAWLLLEKHRPVDEVCKRTGFPRALVERMAADMEKQQAVRKAERQVELAAIRMERGCPMCNTGYANVFATCFPAYSNVREFTDKPVDFFMRAECSNWKCPMRTLQPMPDEYTAVEYFKKGLTVMPVDGYVRLTPLGWQYVFDDLMKRGYTAGELKQLGFKPDVVDRRFMIRDLDRMVFDGVDTELMCLNCGHRGEYHKAVNPHTHRKTDWDCWWRVGCPYCKTRLKHSFPTQEEAQAAWENGQLDQQPATTDQQERKPS